MPAKDTIHDAVKNALIKDGWKITPDPYTIKYEEVGSGGQQKHATHPTKKVKRFMRTYLIFSAEKESCKIVVEIKSFISPSPLLDLKVALGQFEIYKAFLKVTAPEHQLYIAVSLKAYDEIFLHESLPTHNKGISNTIDHRQC
jgi:hypothetical protein